MIVDQYGQWWQGDGPDALDRQNALAGSMAPGWETMAEQSMAAASSAVNTNMGAKLVSGNETNIKEALSWFSGDSINTISVGGKLASVSVSDRYTNESVFSANRDMSSYLNDLLSSAGPNSSLTFYTTGTTTVSSATGQISSVQLPGPQQEGFESKDEAGIAGALTARVVSKALNMETGGDVYSYATDEGTLYGYTPLRAGRSPTNAEAAAGIGGVFETSFSSSTLSNAFIPQAATIAGGYHGHPGTDSVGPSGQDISNTIKVSGYTEYVGYGGNSDNNYRVGVARAGVYVGDYVFNPTGMKFVPHNP
jgi:hypothetical protein